ncbi:hypothetical protein ASPWEDRAFT_45117 [Aspergillus wentii DTO 134E9]|uniref:Uncharacterized protein n=1 Tax=Aspergillus wentii DTO 134E9 TaxID=1073089 RepID=A0A1L9R8A6_ASPWE|nr:uncharacterized protein ASPWEDRAFT_45117 [Aspergillus wentii DTO 134E9]OJJ31156.1 hypothetical protein ASPWEDRAFT_45117 [Aspergillus wentii DTO 134E9]
MAHQSDLPATHIPPFAKPLAPYIKSRQEALRIRQALTAYLRSQIVFADDDPDNPNCYAHSHLSLCAPHDAVVEVKRISPDFTDLRKEYLQALQANVAARKEYESISENVGSKIQGRNAKVETPAQDSNSELQAYLMLLRDRRRHAKLQTFQHYLQELKGRDEAKPEYIDDKEGRNQQLLQPEEFEDGEQNASGAEGGIEGLVHKLERAVIRAKSQLDREKKLFDEIKAQHESAKHPDEGYSTTAKVIALQRTRDELVQWVEEKLVSVGGNDEGPVEDLPPEELEESAKLLEERKAQIAKQYAAYIDARRDLLDAASKACQPVAAAPAKPQPRSLDHGQNGTEETTPLEPLDVLLYASQTLLPLSKSQRALTLQKSYMAGLLAKEKSTALRVLNRLGDESLLLPEYPIMARQPRVNPGATARHSRQSSTATEQIKPDEVVNLAEAWAFASEAAGTKEREHVEENVAMGEEMAQDAQQMLREVYRMLNQDLEGALGDDQDVEQGSGDNWSHGARSTRSQTRQRREEKRSQGPWAALNGRVGVAD